MSNDVKKYLITALTLGLIATGSALLIAGTNAITRDTIAQNEVKQVNKGISNIYGDGAKSVDEQEVKDSNHTYVTTQYVVNNSADALCGYVETCWKMMSLSKLWMFGKNVRRRIQTGSFRFASSLQMIWTKYVLYCLRERR